MITTIGGIYRSLPVSEFRKSLTDALHLFLYYRERELDFAFSHLEKKESQAVYNPLDIENSAGSCDVLFTMVSPNFRVLGVQQKLAQRCKEMGLRTGIIDLGNRKIEGFDCCYKWHPLYPLPNLLKLELLNESYGIFSLLEKRIVLGEVEKRRGVEYLYKYASLVEAYAKSAQVLLESIKPKIVLINSTRYYTNTAMQLACNDNNIISAVTPTGVMGTSQFPVSTSFFMSPAPHYDSYLSELSAGSSKVVPLGCLEPLVAMLDDIDGLIKSSSEMNKGRHKVLILSQHRAAQRIGCPSLLTVLPELIKALKQISQVEKIILRLHPGEKIDSKEVQFILKECNSPKVKITGEEPLINDLREANMIVSMASYGLLYAPYLNMRGIEIRNPEIDSNFGASILPEEHRFSIANSINVYELADFMRDSTVIYGESTLYNWRREVDAFANTLLTMINQ